MATKKPTAAQLAARAKFAEMARTGAFKRKAKKSAAKTTKRAPARKRKVVRDATTQRFLDWAAAKEKELKRRRSNPAHKAAKRSTRTLAQRIESDYYKVEKTPSLSSAWTIAGYFVSKQEAVKFAHHLRDRDRMYVRVRL